MSRITHDICGVLKPVKVERIGKIARQRHCAGGVCGTHDLDGGKHKLQIFDYLPLLILLLLALLFRNLVAAWIFIWMVGFALYAGFKWLTYRQAQGQGAAAI